ncbi:hypothetical protein [Legionella brunensis]|uniref:Substrate of the Dot/Icm secretion system n=1 Tax=Legionella brunensis TaxID=29422 RepID=A0A0W0SNK8_9GAMM|nr:hypothetical protein [Legionella brunensis]KTC84883.1 substrate of the Dot/Icm secretion system [Legionella brunensis]
MGFTLTSYDEIKKSFDRGILTFLGHHEVASVEKLPPHRRGFVEFLQLAIKQIDSLPSKSADDKLKATILTGLMHIVADGLLPRSGSLLRDVLLESMGVREENKKKDIAANLIDANNASRMISEAMKFYTNIVFPSGHTDKMLEQHAFSKIEGMDLVAFEIKAIDMGGAARKQVFAEGRASMLHDVQERERLEAERKKGPSVLSSLGNMIWGNNKKSEEDDEETLEKTPVVQ